MVDVHINSGVKTMRISMDEMLSEAQRRRYAVGYFESWNLESARAVARAAEEERSPLIVGFNGGFLDEHRYELEYYASIGKTAVDLATVPATLLLNEVSGFPQVIRALRTGFSAVMIDVSYLPFEKAMKLTKRVVRLAHLVNVAVEAQFDELPHAKNGVLKGAEKVNMTDPKKALRFVGETGVDALSISTGNVHGLYEAKAKLDLTRLKEIRESVQIPLVLHGATGIWDDDAQQAAQAGVCKINIGHALRLAFSDTMKSILERGISADMEGIADRAETQVRKLIKEKMKVYGCSGHA